MSQSIFNNKTPSWSDTQNRSYKSRTFVLTAFFIINPILILQSANDTPVCDLCQGFSCVRCMLNPNPPSKKRKTTDSNQISFQQSQQQALQNNINNNQNNRVDLTSPPAHNTRSSLKKSHPDTSSLSESQNAISSQIATTKSKSDTTIFQNSVKGLSDSTTSANPSKSKMNVKNLIDLLDDETSKTQPSQGATNAKGLLCPVCAKIIPTATNEVSLNVHIDECLSMKLLEEENTVPKPTSVQQTGHQIQITPFSQETAMDMNTLQQFFQATLAGQPKLKKPAKTDFVKHYDDEDDENLDEEEEEEQEYFSELNEEEEEHLGKVRCPYLGCVAGYLPAEEFGKHVLQTHKGGYQKHLCPICAPTGNYSVHKGTNLYRHVQQFHAFMAFNSPAETTKNLQAKPQPKTQNIQFVEEVLVKDLDNECCICFEQFETGNTVARLPCLCIFHKTCVVRWFEKEKRCPVHEEIPQS